MKSEEQAIKAAQQFIREAEAAADLWQLHDAACSLVMSLERRSEVRDFVRSNAALRQKGDGIGLRQAKSGESGCGRERNQPGGFHSGTSATGGRRIDLRRLRCLRGKQSPGPGADDPVEKCGDFSIDFCSRCATAVLRKNFVEALKVPIQNR